MSITDEVIDIAKTYMSRGDELKVYIIVSELTIEYRRGNYGIVEKFNVNDITDLDNWQCVIDDHCRSMLDKLDECVL